MSGQALAALVAPDIGPAWWDRHGESTATTCTRTSVRCLVQEGCAAVILPASSALGAADERPD